MPVLVLYCVAAGLSLWLSRTVTALSLKAALALGLMPLCFTACAFLSNGVHASVDLVFDYEPFRSHDTRYAGDDTRNRMPIDAPVQFIPWRKAVRWAVANGEWPLWNPFILGGDPLAASAQPAAYHPLTMLCLLLPIHSSLTLSSGLIFFLAGLCAFLFARDMDFREEVALVAAGGWMYASFLVTWHQSPIGLSASVLPLVLLGVRRVCRQPGLASALLLMVAFVLLILGGHPETVVHVVFAGVLYGSFEVVATQPSHRLRAALCGVAAGVAAMLVCAVHLLPVYEAVVQSAEHSARHRVFANEDRSVSAIEALARLSTSFVPFTFGLDGQETTNRPAWFVPSSSAYCGSVLLAPAILGLLASPLRGRWVIAGMGALGALAGASSPVVADLLARIPLLDVAINKRLAVVGGFAVIVLAAAGLEATCGSRSGERRAAFVHLAVALGLCGTIVALWPFLRAYGLSGAFVLSHSVVLIGTPLLAGVLALCVGSTRWYLPLFVGLLLVQRTIEMGYFIPTVAVDDFYPRAAPLDSLPETDEPYRIVAQGDLLIPNTPTMLGLEDVRGYQAVNLRRRRATDRLWSEVGWFNRVDRDSPFLDFLNVRFAVIAGAAEPPPGWEVVAEGPDVRLVENLQALPRAFVPSTVSLGLAPRRVLSEMASAKSFRTRAWIQAPRPGRGAGTRTPNGPGSVVVRRSGSRYELRATMRRAGWMVISETAWPGWRARVDGRRAPVAIANHAYLAVRVPSGVHDVELYYRPTSFLLGRAITFLSMLGLTGALVLYRWRRRRGGTTFAPRPHPEGLDDDPTRRSRQSWSDFVTR